MAIAAAEAEYVAVSVSTPATIAVVTTQTHALWQGPFRVPPDSLYWCSFSFVQVLLFVSVIVRWLFDGPLNVGDENVGVTRKRVMTSPTEAPVSIAIPLHVAVGVLLFSDVKFPPFTHEPATSPSVGIAPYRTCPPLRPGR
jgi:hypothetical protein